MAGTKPGHDEPGMIARLTPMVPDDDSLSSSWPDLFRPSTSLMLFGFQEVDARDKRGHDESITQGRSYHTFSNGTLIVLRFSSHSGTGRFLERMKSGLNSLD
jgi:hypothetical protein